MVTKVGEKVIEGLDNFTETEFNEAIKTLEDDDILAQLGHREDQTIRFK